MTQRLDEATRLALIDKHLEGNSYIYELDLIADMLEAAPLGIKSTELAVLCGYHWSDFSSLQSVLKQLREQYGLKLKTYSNFTHKLNYFIVITEENVPYLRLKTACSRAVRQAGLQEPPQLTEARAKAKARRQADKSAQRQSRADAERVKAQQHRAQKLLEWAAVAPPLWSYRHLCDYYGVSRARVVVIVRQWVQDGLCTQVSSGGVGGAGHKNMFSITQKKW